MTLPAQPSRAVPVPISALTIAATLQMPPPTAEQQRVIEAPLTPTLVVAGAGSGKTETMANRVLWLLANGHARADQILGLTFTRKAAGELAERINRRIGELAAAGLMPVPAMPEATEDSFTRDTSDLFNTPAVSTYNSFASRLFTDNALLLGREPESVLLDENSAWLLARQVVISQGDGQLVPFGKKVDAVTDAVLALSRALAENPPPFIPVADRLDVPGHDLAGLAAGFDYLAELPYGSPRKKIPYASVTESIAAVAPLPVLARLAASYQAEKHRLGLIEFSDQVALALQVCQKVHTVVDRYRDQYRIVLLDEYQDTSVLQTELLHTLFAHHPVMAVGDPHQSIYGWRGASSANLLGFSRSFAGLSNAEAPAMSLSCTWRNPVTVLGVANALVAPLSEQLRAQPGGIQVETLKTPPGKTEGTVEAAMVETIADEAQAVASWFAARLPSTGSTIGSDKTGAMLFRARREMDLFAEVLREHGVRAHVLGLGGLLSTPEVADVISVLRAVHDPSAGSELVRLLSGGRWRLGVRDLQALAGVAGWLATHDWAQKKVSDEVRARLRDSVVADDGRSLVDALDFVATAAPAHGQLVAFSETGRERLRDAGRQLAFFRSRAGLPLLDFVRLIEQELRLDIELVANETRGLENLYAFHDTVGAFLDSDEQGTLGSFLRWLTRAERNDDLGPRPEPGEAGAVQLLTIHGAKGLEWDFVAIPNLTAKSLPAPAREVSGWLRFGELPYPFRGDRAELPQLRWGQHDTQLSYDAEFLAFKDELAARHDAEERRLIYVATTRSQHSLLLTGSYWASGSTVRGPSPYLVELAEAGLIPALPDGSVDTDKPASTDTGREIWPFDPLGIRRPVVEAAAALVVTAQAARQAATPSDAAASTSAGSEWAREVTLLLEERALRLAGGVAVELPVRIPASRFKDYVDDAAAVTRGLARPMPERPYRATRLGTLFHSWVEQRSGGVASGDQIDAGLFELDDADPLDAGPLDAGPLHDAGLGDNQPGERERLAVLQRTFEQSPWASRRPVDVEIEIHLALAGQVFICKLDAVYETPTGYQVVDWKTGRAPKNAADLELKQTQLALYRLAYARWKGIDPGIVDAVFYFVADDTIIAPDRLYSEEDLRAAWASASAPVATPAPSVR
ncbi:ATP-dependent helicase [Cryobacterium melibiosiphilum]|uniref:DNA 3'-5' helicase n=1 Tax=Cryobacterium melibiosiphilum TaxID=995039 RepID=A0A3A5MG23_9MICO|nr:ATP-dependent DNA helicase [Cryobacterium melibiosiphilum]RJT88372.1 ATP-dependent helicase [Cryobacterium melibiosiphilum]